MSYCDLSKCGRKDGASCRDAMKVIVRACPLIIDRERKCHLYRTNQNKCNKLALRIMTNYVRTQFTLRVTNIRPFLRAENRLCAAVRRTSVVRLQHCSSVYCALPFADS